MSRKDRILVIPRRGEGRVVSVAPSARPILIRLLVGASLVDLASSLESSKEIKARVAAVADFVERLAAVGLVENPTASRVASTSALEMSIPVGRLLELLTRIFAIAGENTRRTLLIVAAAASLICTSAAFLILTETVPVIPSTRILVFAIAVGVIVSIAAHELAHATALRLAGFYVERLHISLGLPTRVFVDLTELHAIGDSTQLFWVTAAGPAADLFLAGLMSAITLLTAPRWPGFSVTAVTFGFATCAFLANLSPLPGSDGAGMLDALLDEKHAVDDSPGRGVQRYSVTNRWRLVVAYCIFLLLIGLIATRALWNR